MSPNFVKMIFGTIMQPMPMSVINQWIVANTLHFVALAMQRFEKKYLEEQKRSSSRGRFEPVIP